jgi:adenine phosphoribosyltransferase
MMNLSADKLDLKKFVREIPDFPKAGINFKDITPLLCDAQAFHAAIERMAQSYERQRVDFVAGIESRGFLLASALAYRLKAGLIPLRKKGKLPYKTLSVSYALEYGTDSVEVHVDAAPKGAAVLLVDDVLATGGTAHASLQLIDKLGAKALGPCFLIELEFLKGRDKLAGWDILSLIQYS